MPKITNSNVIREYWEEVKDQYPDISFEKFEIVCKSIFTFCKFCIRLGTLPIISLKYFGKIRPYRVTLKRMIDSYKDKTEEEYVVKHKFLTEYLEKLLIYDKKNKRAAHRKI